MLSLVSKSLLALLLVILVALVTILLVDERSTSTAASLCKLSNGHTVVVKTIYHSVFARLLRHLSGGSIYAITLRNRIYVSSGYLVPTGLAHEHEHVKQWYKMGSVRFVLTYAWYYFKVGYVRHPLEVAARYASGDHPWLR